LKKIFDLYLKSSIHVGLAVSSFTALTYLHLEVPVNTELVLFCFFSTIVAYNSIKYLDLIVQSNSSFSTNLKIILIISGLSMAGMAYFIQIFGWIEILFLATLSLVSYLYSNTPSSRFKSLRSTTGIKIIIIAMVWTGTTVILPGLSEDFISESRLWGETFQRFLLVIVLTLPFDLRDLRVDYGEIKTIPQLIGIKQTKILSGTLCFLIIISELLFTYKEMSSSITLIVVTALLFLITAKLTLFQTKYMASFWVEGIPIAWFVFLNLWL